MGTHQLNDLTTDNILDKVHSLRRGILDLAKDEHLKPRPRKSRLGIVLGILISGGAHHLRYLLGVLVLPQ